VESPSLEIFQTCLDMVLCSLLWVTLLGQGVGLGDHRGPCQPLPCWDSIYKKPSASCWACTHRTLPSKSKRDLNAQRINDSAPSCVSAFDTPSSTPACRDQIQTAAIYVQNWDDSDL